MLSCLYFQEGVTLHRSNPNKSLLSACDFMYKIRIGRTDDDPKFHDHATFLTRYVLHAVGNLLCELKIMNIFYAFSS